MFLLRRKKDGKFWRNRSSNSFSSYRIEEWEKEWVADPSLCTPFQSRSGAGNNRGTNLTPPYKVPIGDEWQNKEIRDAYHKKSGEWYSKANAPARKAQFDTQYEVVPISISVETA